MSASDVSSYDALANEYYDLSRHPTSASLREASVVAFETCGKGPWPGPALEVGAGRTILADVPGAVAGPVELLDASRDMLRHSQGVVGAGGLVQARCEALPFRDSSFRTVISILGDPYNQRAFWTEVARVLTPGGESFYTTPSWDWACRYREIEGGKQDQAEFESHGSLVHVTSLVYPVPVQTALIEEAGLRVRAVLSIPQVELRTVAPKLAQVPESSVVTAFIARRP